MIRVGGTGQVNFNIGTGGAWNELNSPNNVVSLNTWHHIAATYDGITMRLYVDGVQVGTNSLTSNIGSATQNLFIGEDPQFTGRYFPGRIDEVRVWNVTRSAQQIQENMKNYRCPTYPTGLVAYYKFDQGVANAINTGVDEEISAFTSTLINSRLTGSISNWVEGVPSTTTLDSTLTLCQGDSVLIGGNYRMMTGTYYDSLQATNGCDSLIRIALTINQIPVTNTNISICQGDSILLYGTYQTVAGVYTDTLQSVTGCDSVLATTLSVVASSTTTANVVICQGDSALIAGSYRFTAGMYVDTLQNRTGCDSILRTTLFVTNTPTVTLAAFMPDTVCMSNMPIPLPAAMPSGGVYTGLGVVGTTFSTMNSGAGIFSVTYTYVDSMGCVSSATTPIVVDVCLGVSNPTNSWVTTIAPNPTSNQLSITLNNSTPLTLKLIDVVGSIVQTEIIPANKATISLDLQSLPQGVYFLVLSHKDQQTIHKIYKE